MSQTRLQTQRTHAWQIHLPLVVPAATALVPATNYLALRAPVPLRIFTGHVNVRTAIDIASATSGKFEFRKGTAANNNTPTADVLQQETAVASGTIGTGTARITVTAAGMTNSPKNVDFTVVAADDASAIAGKARTALAADADVAAFFTVSGSTTAIILTAKTKAANDATMNMASADVTSNGITEAASSANTTAGAAAVLQVETATAAGNVSTSGNCTVTVTAAGMTNSPKAISVAVLDTDDDGSAIAGKIRTALAADTDVAAFFTVSGATDKVILTSKAAAANDATMNIAIIDGTSVGVTTAATSANTTAGVLGVLQIETATITGTITGTGNATVITTAAGMTGSPITTSVAVVDGDTAVTWAGKVRTALALNANITDKFAIGGSGANIVLTRLVSAADDATMNLSLNNGTSFGIVAALTSTNTTGGVAPVSGVVSLGQRMTIAPGNYGSGDEDQSQDGFTLEANQALYIRCLDIGDTGAPAGLDVSLTVGFA